MKNSTKLKSNSRRRFLGNVAASVLISSSSSGTVEQVEAGAINTQDSPSKLPLENFQPRSMLVVPEHPVLRARFPVIDVHSHISNVYGPQRATDSGAADSVFKQLDQIVGWMDQLNIKTFNNLTGGYGETLKRSISDLQGRYKGRFLNCVVPAYDKLREPNYPAWQADELQRAKEAGAIGLKITKTRGLYLREDGQDGQLGQVDGP